MVSELNRGSARLVRLSAWMVGDYARCPFQYRKKHQSASLPVTEEPQPALTCGNSLHAALPELHRPGQLAQPVDAHPLLARHWDRRGYTDAEQERQWFGAAELALERYLANRPLAAGQVLGTEVFLAARWKHGDTPCELTARVDRIDRRDDGALEIIDYKAALNGRLLTPEALAADLVSYVYTVLARVTYPGHERVIVTHLNLFSLQTSSAELTPEQRQVQRAALLAVIDGVAAGRFETRPGQHCAWCPVRAACPEFSATLAPDQL